MGGMDDEVRAAHPTGGGLVDHANLKDILMEHVRDPSARVRLFEALLPLLSPDDELTSVLEDVGAHAHRLRTL